MNKSNLIETVAEQTNISVKDASSIVHTILEAMTESLARGEGIEIRGFGSFIVKKYKSYQGRNPKTGEVLKVSPKKLPFFKVGKNLREKINS